MIQNRSRCFSGAAFTAALVITVAAFADDNAPAADSGLPVSPAAWDRYDERLAELEWRLQQIEPGDSGPVDCCVEPTIYAGYSFLFAKPHLKESFEATVTNPVAGTLQLVPLDNDYNLTPRVWLGMTNSSGRGLRVSYWQYDHAGNPQTLVSDGLNIPGATVTTVIYPATIIAPAPGDTLTTSNSLIMHTLDLEGTIDVSFGSLEARLGGGLRYARIEQVMAARAMRGPATIGTLNWTREMEGVGPLLSANVRHGLWGRLSAVGRARASVLFGNKSLERNVVGDVTPAPTAVPPQVRLQHADEVTAGFDLGLGLEWRHYLASGHELFVQGMYEGQLWTEAGAPTLTFLGFEGFSLSTGFVW